MIIQKWTDKLVMGLSKDEIKLLLAVASTDSTRRHLNALVFQPDKRRVVATDGHRLVMVEAKATPPTEGTPPEAPLEANAMDTEFMLSRDDAALALKQMSVYKASQAFFSRNDKTIEVSVIVATQVYKNWRGEYSPPPYEQVVPKYEDERKIAPVVGFNALYLSDIALMGDCMESEKGGKKSKYRTNPVKVRFGADERDPVLITGETPTTSLTMVLMPVRL